MKATFSFLLSLFLLGNAINGFSHELETLFTNTTNPPVFVSSNTQAQIGVFDLSGMGITMSSFTSQAMDADGIYYDSENDVIYQLNRTDNVINAYSGVCDSLAVGSSPALTATSTSDFINGREIAIAGNKLVVAQDASPDNGGLNKFFIYNITPTDIILEKSFEVRANLWGFRILDNTVFAVIDNSNQIAIFNGFFDYADGSIVDPTNVATVAGITRTHGITYIPAGDRMILTDIGDAALDDDGAIVYVDGFFNAIGGDFLIEADEQIRIEGPNSTLGNPVDVVFEEEGQRIFVAERANGGGKLLAFDLPTDNGDAMPVYSSDFAGASAVTLADENIPFVNLVSRFYASSNTSGNIGAYEILDNGILQFSTFAAGGIDADGIHYDIENDVLYQLDRTNNVINLYGQVKASLDINAIPPLVATSTSNFINGREIVISNGELVVAQDASVDNGMQNKFVVYDITPTSITFDRSHDVPINLWGITAADQVIFAVVDNSNEVALFDEFFSQPDGPLSPDFTFSVENMVRTHGIFYDFLEDVMYLTDVGDPTNDTDGAIVIIPDFILSVVDINISANEQIRIEGGNTFLGNPVDIGYDPLLEIVFVAERANNGGAILGFEVPTQGGDFTPIYNSVFPGASAINVPYITRQPVDCDIVLGGTVALANGGTDTTIVIDGQPDLIVFSTDVMLNGFQFTYVVTDDQGIILEIPAGNTVDFDPAGTGTCRVYGLSYSGELLIEAGDNLLEVDLIISDDCFDISDNNLTINRVSDPCEVIIGGTVELASGGTTTTIIIDGEADIIEFASDGANGGTFTYVITDSEGNILGIPAGNSVDFDPAGPGSCLVYGLSYTGTLNIMIDDNLFEAGLQISDECFDLSSNNLTIIRIPDPCADVDGGTVELAEGGLTTTIIIDGIADVIEFTSDGATGDSFTYVVTDSEGNILGIPAGNSVDFDPAGPGSCLVYGLSYTGDLNIMVGDNLLETDLQISDECFDLSSNNLTIIRIPDPCADVDGGTVELAEGGLTTTIIIDGVADVIEFTSDGATGDSFTYVVTDSEGNILGIPAGNSVDFDPAGPGSCLVYGLSYTGDLNIMVGDNLLEAGLQISNECFDLSSNNLTIVRIDEVDPCEDVDGGTVELAEGGLTTTIIIDGIADVIEFTSDGATGDSFTYVVTDSEGNILGIPAGNSVDFDPAGPGSCLVYGLSYTGDLNIMVGDNLLEAGLQISDECFDLSSNNLTIVRIDEVDPCADVDGGTVELAEGGLTTTIIIDGIADVIEFTSDGATGDSFTYVVTDSEGNILGIPAGNSVDFDPAGPGSCLVYGLSYTGDLNIMVGDNLLEAGLQISDECFDLSSNNLTIVRIDEVDPCEEISGGTVELAEGGLTTTIIIDGIADVIEFTSDGATGDSFTYVVTDSEGNILGIPAGSSVDFDPAGPGSCLVYGLSYTGDLNIMVGDNLLEAGLQISDECFDLSSNNLTIVRIDEVDPCEEISGGTVELAEGGLTTTIIIDGVADIIEFSSDGATGTSFTYVVTDSDGNILGIPSGNSVDFDPAGPGTCLVYGLSYTGDLNIMVGDNLLETGLQISSDCFALSSNNLTIVRIEDNDDGADLSIAITADDLVYDIFENTTFTIVVTNNGPATATGISVAAALPTGLVYTSDVASQGDYVLFNETWNVGTLSPGTSATLELSLFSTVEDVEILMATEVLTSDQNDPDSTPGNGANGEDDYASVTLIPDTVLPTGADLSITINANNLLYENYENTTFTITVTNNGPENATGITVAAPLPEGFVYTDDQVSQGDYDLFFEIWNVGSLDAGASATLELELFSLIEDVNVMVVTEILTADQNDPDSTPGNGPNEEDDYDFVVLTPEDGGGIGTGIGVIDLELSVTVDQSIYDQYENVDYVITITNNGPDVAENIAIAAGVPEGLAYTSDNPSTGDYDLWLKRWTISSLDAGETATLVLQLFTTSEGSINYFTEVLFVNQNDDDSFPGNGDGVTPQEDDEAAVGITVVNMPNAILNDSNSGPINLLVTELYPNPTTNLLTLEMESLVEQEATLQIYNVMGAIVKSQPIFVQKNSNVFQVSVGNLPEGNYLIRVPGTEILKRFIKVARP